MDQTFDNLMATVRKGQGCARFSILVEYAGRLPAYVTDTRAPATARVFVFYDLAACRAAVLMIDGNHLASITNAASEILPFIHRDQLARRGVRWKDTVWCYRDTTGAWDQLFVDSWRGGTSAAISFRPLGERGMDDAIALLAKHGFQVDSHDIQHIRLAIRRSERKLERGDCDVEGDRHSP